MRGLLRGACWISKPRAQEIGKHRLQSQIRRLSSPLSRPQFTASCETSGQRSWARSLSSGSCFSASLYCLTRPPVNTPLEWRKTHEKLLRLFDRLPSEYPTQRRMLFVLSVAFQIDLVFARCTALRISAGVCRARLAGSPKRERIAAEELQQLREGLVPAPFRGPYRRKIASARSEAASSSRPASPGNLRRRCLCQAGLVAARAEQRERAPPFKAASRLLAFCSASGSVFLIARAAPVIDSRLSRGRRCRLALQRPRQIGLLQLLGDAKMCRGSGRDRKTFRRWHEGSAGASRPSCHSRNRTRARQSPSSATSRQNDAEACFCPPRPCHGRAGDCRHVRSRFLIRKTSTSRPKKP